MQKECKKRSLIGHTLLFYIHCKNILLDINPNQKIKNIIFLIGMTYLARATGFVTNALR